jgi:tetratricopeptide (TPR) repeat protein
MPSESDPVGLLIERAQLESERPPVVYAGRDWGRLLRIFGSLPAACGLLGAAILSTFLIGADLQLVDNYMNAARDAAEVRDEETVLLVYRRLVKHRPDSEEFRFRLAQTYYRVGRHDQGEALLRQLVPADGRGYEPARLWWARRLATSPSPTAKELQEAERQLNSVLKFDPKNAAALTTLCRLCLDQGRLSETEQYLLQAPPETLVDLRLALARAFRQIGDRRSVAKYAGPAETFFSQRIFRDPADVQSRIFAAEALTLQERFDEAVTVLQAQVCPNSGSQTYAALGGVYLAWAQFQDDRVPKGRRTREKLLEKCVAFLKQAPTDDADVDRQLASALILLRKLDEAEPYLRRAIQTHPSLLLEWARLHGVLGDTTRAVIIAEEAEQKYAEALSREPQSEELRILAADAQFLLRRYEAALTTLEDGITGKRQLVLKRAAARVLVGWFDAVEDRKDWVSRTAAIQLLLRALEFEAWDMSAIQRLETARSRWRGEANPAGLALDGLLTTEDPPVAVLATLGARATATGELERARELLEKTHSMRLD